LFWDVESLIDKWVKKIPVQYRRLDSKEEQVEIATYLGLEIAGNLYYQYGRSKSNLARSHQMVFQKYKTLTIVEWCKKMLTNVIQERDLESIDTTILSMQFQEN